MLWYVISGQMRNYKRKTTKGSTPRDVLQRAAAEIENGRTIRSVAIQFNVNRMTLKRYITKRATNPDAVTGYQAVAANKAVFPSEMEQDLANHIKLLADMFHGLSVQKCCTLAYEFALHNKLNIPESWAKNGKAGTDWWLLFRSRQHLAVRSPEATSFARSSAFNRPVVNQFYDNLATVMDANHFQPEDIFNCDETGCTTVQRPKQVVTEQGRKQVGSITSAERGELVTVVYTVSASGNVIPPLFIFPRVNYKDYFIRGAPPGSVGRATRSGWINEDIFLEYLQHIIRNTRCSPDHKILLIMDNHESHVSLKVIDTAKANGIVLLTIPPHTSHRLQPLDRSVYGPFKGAYNRAMDAWLRSNPGKTVTIYDIPSLVNEAQMSAVIPRNILSGFQSTGIFPFNRELFSDVDFAPAVTTDRVIEIDQATEEGSTSQPKSNEPEKQMQTDPPVSETTCCTSPVTSPNLPGTSGSYVSPAALLPIPKAQARKKTSKGRKRGRTKILTDTPVRDEIASAIKTKPTKKTTSNEPAAKKKLFNESDAHVDAAEETDAADAADSNSSLSETDVELDDDSDDAIDEMDIMEGDFVVVKVDGKSRSVHYIARIDVIDGKEYEGIFLQKVPGRVDSEEATFVPNPDDEAFFPEEDIVYKLPQPKSAGGSSRRSGHLVFKCSLDKWRIK